MLYGNFRKSPSSETKGLPIIRCSCGSKILLVPSIKEMSAVIEAHVEKHTRRVGDPAEAKAQSEKIRNNLIEQLFDLAPEL